MTGRLTKHRRYGQFGSTPRLVALLSSVGTTTVVQTVVPRRRRAMGYSQANVKMLPSYGAAGAGPSSGVFWIFGDDIIR